MDFMGIATWIFDLLVLQLLPLFSLVLLAIGIIGVINRLPDTLTNYVKAQADKLQTAFRRK
jgi:hypothetical protein